MRGPFPLIVAIVLGLMGLPAVASAAEARRSPDEFPCTGTPSDPWLEEGKRRLQQDDTVTTGLRILRRQGEPGCQLILEWLAGGAPHASDEQIEDALEIAGDTELEGSMRVVLGYVDHEDRGIRVTSLDVLDRRLATFSDDEMEYLVTHPEVGVRRRAVDLIVGVHWDIHVDPDFMDLVPDVNIEIEELWARDSVPGDHIAWLEGLAADGAGAVRERVATALGYRLLAGKEIPRSWTAHLVALLEDPNGTVANRAAEALGMGAPSGGLSAIDALLELEDRDLVDEYLDGVEIAIEEEALSDRLVTMVQKVADEGPAPHATRAARLAREALREMREQREESEDD